MFGGQLVRVIDAEIAIATTAGRRTGTYRLVATLLDPRRYLRTAMADATATRPGVDPDRASFTVALNAARDLVAQAASVIADTAIADTVIDLVGKLGRVILASLMPDRRVRLNARTVKRAISKHNARGPNIDRTTYKATIDISILAGSALTSGPSPQLPALGLVRG